MTLPPEVRKALRRTTAWNMIACVLSIVGASIAAGSAVATARAGQRDDDCSAARAREVTIFLEDRDEARSVRYLDLLDAIAGDYDGDVTARTDAERRRLAEDRSVFDDLRPPLPAPKGCRL